MLGEADLRRGAARRRSTAAPGAAASSPAYFTDYLRREIEELGASDVSDTPGARVYSSVDVNLQRFAEAAVARGLDRLESRLPAAAPDERRPAAGRARSRSIRAPGRCARSWAAATTRRASSTARSSRAASRARRSSRSSTSRRCSPERQRRVFTAASVVDDSPLTLQVGRDAVEPAQLRGPLRGPGDRAPRARALAQQRRGARRAGGRLPGRDRDRARARASRARSRRCPPLALGAFEVTPLELARAYVAVRERRRAAARAGRARRPPTRATAPRSSSTTPEPEAPLTPAEAYLMTSLLEGVVEQRHRRRRARARRARRRSRARRAPPTTGATRGSSATRRRC